MTDELKPGHCHKCGLQLSDNPHSEAGKPAHYLKVGCPKECIPCLTLSRHQWAGRAMKAENELADVHALLSASKPAAIDKDAAESYRRGLREAFDIANMITANRQGRSAEEICAYLVRKLAGLANGGEIPAGPAQSDEVSRLSEANKLLHEQLETARSTIGALRDAAPAQSGPHGNDELFARVTDWVNAHGIPFEAQNELFRILAATQPAKLDNLPIPAAPAQSEEPVAWMYRRIDPGSSGARLIEKRAEAPDGGWVKYVEIPLYAAPQPSQPVEAGEAIKCATCQDGTLLPQYGVAPHDCYHKLGKSIGQSEAHSADAWPSNFEVDSESNGECGLFHCPACGPKFKAGKPISAAVLDDERAAESLNAVAKSVFGGINALRWLLNITTEFDRKDVRTRQAARLLDEYCTGEGTSNRVHLERLWKTLNDSLSLEDTLECLRAPDRGGAQPLEQTRALTSNQFAAIRAGCASLQQHGGYAPFGIVLQDMLDQATAARPASGEAE
jgi:hypothetical protein